MNKPSYIVSFNNSIAYMLSKGSDDLFEVICSVLDRVDKLTDAYMAFDEFNAKLGVTILAQAYENSREKYSGYKPIIRVYPQNKLGLQEKDLHFGHADDLDQCYEKLAKELIYSIYMSSECKAFISSIPRRKISRNLQNVTKDKLLSVAHASAKIILAGKLLSAYDFRQLWDEKENLPDIFLNDVRVAVYSADETYHAQIHVGVLEQIYCCSFSIERPHGKHSDQSFIVQNVSVELVDDMDERQD